MRETSFLDPQAAGFGTIQIPISGGDDLEESSRFFKGILSALALAVPLWAFIGGIVFFLL